MAIPADILRVERPKNTFVVSYGSKDCPKYAVRKRLGCKYDKGRRLPINGPTIGHIINFKYIPIEGATVYEAEQKGVIDRISKSSVDLKDWANVELCNILLQPILQDLYKVYNQKDAEIIFCIAILRVCFPGVKDYELKEAYETSFLSEFYPDVPLSKNSVSMFLKNLGKSCSKIIDFMQIRTANVKESHHLLVDGTLKSNESRINTLSDYSRKALKKGTRDISVLYAFDLEEKEPICSKCYPGNMLDLTAYENFITENNITQGIIVGDKGFPESSAKTTFMNNPKLHFINPIKRDSKVIKELNLNNFDGVLKNNEKILSTKRYNESTAKWYYHYKDLGLAAQEENDYVHRQTKQASFDVNTYNEKKVEFGTLTLESDLDLPSEIAFDSYNCRWEIELVMRFYKHACEFDETRVHNDYSVIGSEFCDFLSTLLTYKLINFFDEHKLFETMTYKSIMKKLQRAKKIKLSKANGWTLIKIAPALVTMLQSLGLLPKEEIKKRGRPKKAL